MLKSSEGREIRGERSEMEAAFREQRKIVSEQRIAITEQREIQMSVQPLASNDGQYRLAANSKQKVGKAIGEQVTGKKIRAAIRKQVGVRTKPRETIYNQKIVGIVEGTASS